MRAGRIEALDALRGLAALAVVFHHSLLAIFGPIESQPLLAWIYLTPLRLFVNGSGAVVLFFVISGFVLAPSALRMPYGEFVARRVCRIWIPFAAVILAAAVVSYLVAAGPIMGYSDQFDAAWAQPAQIGQLLKLLAMVGPNDLDGPAWTLIHELRISLILPLLMLLVVRGSRLALATTAAVAVVALAALNLAPMPGTVAFLLMTVAFVPMFVLGLCLSQRADEARARLAALPTPARVGLWLLALAGLAIVPVGTDALVTGLTPLLVGVCGVAATLLIVLSISGTYAQRVLDSPVPRFLGRISYSLYLIHVVVIQAVGRALHDVLSPGVSVVIAISLSIALADLSQRWLEVPSTNLGRYLGNRLRAYLRPSAALAAASAGSQPQG